MPSSKVMQQFQAFIHEIERLGELEESAWRHPIGPDKWTLGEMVCHLWYWDKFSLEVMAPLMADGAKLPQFPNIESHNQEAIGLANRFKSPVELIKTFMQTRSSLIALLENRYDKRIRFTIGEGKRNYGVDSYVQIFVHHDAHHGKQIKETVTNRNR